MGNKGDSMSLAAIKVAEENGPRLFGELICRDGFPDGEDEVQRMYIGGLASGIAIGIELGKRLQKIDAGDSEVVDDETTRAVFIGGPWHRELRVVQSHQTLIECGDGFYTKEYLGFDGHLFELAYVWSELLISDAVDMVTDAVKRYVPQDCGQSAGSSSSDPQLKVVTRNDGVSIEVDGGSTKAAVRLGRLGTEWLIGELEQSLNGDGQCRGTSDG